MAVMNGGKKVVAALAVVTIVALLGPNVIGNSKPVSYTAAPISPASVPIPTVSQWSAAPGTELRVTGSGFQPGTMVGIAFGSGHASGSAVAVGRDGKISTMVVVPAGAAPGWDCIALSGVARGGQALVEDVALDVVGASAEGATPSRHG